jgi:hypothetical protein
MADGAALVGSYELLMIIHSSQARAEVGGRTRGPDVDPLQLRAAQVFADDLIDDHVPSVRCSRPASCREVARQRVKAYLATITSK